MGAYSNDQYTKQGANEKRGDMDDEDMSDLVTRDEFVFKNGAKYKGQWKDEMRHGYGI